MNKDNQDLDAQAPEYYQGLHDALIMMVDDEPILMAVIEEFLREAGYVNFLAVEDSTLALKTIRQEKPAVLLLDLVMPDVDGFEILEAVRVDSEQRHLPVIVLTSSSDGKTKLRALEMGATDFLAKPVDSSELILRLRNTLTVRAYQDQLAYYDTLTGLPNRILFLDRLKWALQHAKRLHKSAGILNIDLDRFKHVNDTLGPQVGDALLTQVASRLTDCIRMDDYISRVNRQELWRSVSRLGGDEFSVVLHEVAEAEHAAYVARRLNQALEEPFYVDEHEIYLSSSIGIALYPDDGRDVDLLMKSAAVATGYAKQQGRGNYKFYARELNAESEELFQLETDLRRAIERGQLELYYQPKIDCATGKVSGMEALCRWHHSERGMISPTEFIPLAEQTGLIIPMGKWILNDVCQQYSRWRSEGMQPLMVSVNVSGHQFQDKDLCNSLENTLSVNQMNPKHLMIEITESVLMNNIEGSLQTLHDIRDLGPSLSIDDFGTGYSSLTYLKLFPIEELKIDRAFIMDLPESRNDRAIVRAVIALADGLDLEVVAEGVETKQQVTFLNEQNCGLIQGFYYSEPLPADQFQRFLIEQNGL